MPTSAFITSLTLQTIARTSSTASVRATSTPTVTTTTITAEVLHRSMMAEASAKGVITSGQPPKKLKADPSVTTKLSSYIAEIGDLLLLPLEVIEVSSADVRASRSLRRAHGFFVNDSINLACADRLGIAGVATHDADLQRVPHVRVWEPLDV